MMFVNALRIVSDGRESKTMRCSRVKRVKLLFERYTKRFESVCESSLCTVLFLSVGPIVPTSFRMSFATFSDHPLASSFIKLCRSAGKYEQMLIFDSNETTSFYKLLSALM